jgi:hypothetical protein
MIDTKCIEVISSKQKKPEIKLDINLLSKKKQIQNKTNQSKRKKKTPT